MNDSDGARVVVLLLLSHAPQSVAIVLQHGLLLPRVLYVSEL